MRKVLTDKQRRFVEIYIASGGQNAKQCAMQAGYSGVDVAHTAWELLQKPKIIQAIIDGSKTEGGAALPQIMKTMLEIAVNPQHPHCAKVGLAMLGIYGISPINKSESRRVVEHNIPALERVKQLMQQLALSPGSTIVDVTPVALPSPEDEPIQW